MSERHGDSSFESHPRKRDCLVAVVNHDSDLLRFHNDSWYRIPDRILGRSIARNALEESSTLALYQSTAVTEGLPQSIEWWGEIDGIETVRRRELIPEEPTHPAAEELYHRIGLSNIHRLERPIVSRVPRRITFLRTTRERLLRASDINDLVIGSRTEEALWQSIRERSDEFDRRIFMEVDGTVMEVDIGFVGTDGGVAVMLNGSDAVHEQEHPESTGPWRILRFSPTTLESDMSGCVRQIMEAARSVRSMFDRRY